MRRSTLNSHIEQHTDREPIHLQNVAFGLALGESVTRVAENTGLSRRTLQNKLQDEHFVNQVRYWQDLYAQTLTEFLTTDLRRSIKRGLFKSVSKGEGLANHTDKAPFMRHTAAPKEADELESLAKKAEMRQKMLQ